MPPEPQDEGTLMTRTARRLRAMLLLAAVFHAPQAAAQIWLPLLPCPVKTPIKVSITSSANGDTVSGVITVRANASDNRGVAGVQFRLDGSALGVEDTGAPYEITWDSRSAPD